MALSVDVKLPRDKKPIFPEGCVACGAEPAESRLQLRTRALGMYSILAFFSSLFHLAQARVEVDVSICDSCKRANARRRFRRTVLSFISVGVGVVVALWLIEDAEFGRGTRKLVILGILVVCMLPVILWEILCPAPVDVTATTKSVTYEFRNRKYAEDFVELNDAELE